MSGLDWERVRRIFQATVEEPAPARHAYLAAACADDAALRQEVESLLAAHAAAGGFLETPVIRLEDCGQTGRGLALAPGDRVGGFEILGALGTGGMGEVYRGRDKELHREVAIKLLPPAFATDRQRLARFERESRILASLRHPNIASIHSVEQVGDLRLLILELIEGPTLADRLRAGPAPLADALTVARQLAGALEAAHERGIVHRDIKPANVKLEPSGRVVLLDFGLAKDSAASGVESAAPADGLLYTTAGLILGTCAYMSPEQARGHATDKRTDIWAFGCILFELLSGRRAFDGATASDTIAALMERQPDWRALPESLPASIRTLLERCLQKDANRRLHDIADARIEIDDALAPRAIVETRGSRRRPRAMRAVGATAIAAASVALGWALPRGDSGTAAIVGPAKFTWAVPVGLRLESPAVVSPDGRRFAFAASAAGEPPRIFVRALDALEAQAIPRTEGAQHPFWAPDSRSVAYFARGKLLKVAIESGVPVEICAAAVPMGGAWGSKGVIVFAPNTIFSGLLRVAAEEGATPEPATMIDSARGENSHRWPAFLPDGVHFVYFVRSVAAERRGVYLGRIDRAATPGEPLFRSESEAIYVPTDGGSNGLLLNAAGGHIDVRPFDGRRLTLEGDPTRLDLPAGGITPHHGSMLSGSAELLTHVASPMPYGRRLVSSLPAGEVEYLDTEPSIINWPRVSPDGRRIVSQRLDPLTGSPDLWVEDLERRTKVRLTREGTSGQLPVWSPDGAQVAFVAGTFDDPVVTIAAADGTGAIATLPCPRFRCEPSDWSRDGRWLLATAIEKDSAEVWMLPTGPGVARPLLTEAFSARDARLSPDGRLVAYVAEETGRAEISVRTVEGPRQREVVSVSGGTQPVWNRTGTDLLFVDLEGVLRSVTVGRTAEGRPTVGRPSVVGSARIGTGHYGTQYDVAPDGRVYLLDSRLAEAQGEIGIVMRWRELLKK